MERKQKEEEARYLQSQKEALERWKRTEEEKAATLKKKQERARRELVGGNTGGARVCRSLRFFVSRPFLMHPQEEFSKQKQHRLQLEQDRKRQEEEDVRFWFPLAPPAHDSSLLSWLPLSPDP